jgi:hypothetical protein
MAVGASVPGDSVGTGVSVPGDSVGEGSDFVAVGVSVGGGSWLAPHGSGSVRRYCEHQKMRRWQHVSSRDCMSSLALQNTECAWQQSIPYLVGSRDLN